MVWVVGPALGRSCRRLSLGREQFQLLLRKLKLELKTKRIVASREDSRRALAGRRLDKDKNNGTFSAMTDVTESATYFKPSKES